VSPLDPEVPPAGEEVHLPGPSLLPFLAAIGITLSIVGITLGPVFYVPGLILTVVVLWRWIRSTREDVEQLPLEH
jgi:hypothetical protein